MYIPEDVNFIIKRLNDAGYEAYMVGGCVRDIIMNKLPKDWDITTSAKPDEIKNIFSKTVDSGIKHGTVTIILNKKIYEVTTYRIDGLYENFRKPKDVIFTDKINEDLKRRDFTMNAIAYHSKIGFIDPYGGINDIKNCLIKGVGDPSVRFKEDALRMLRAIRFSCQTGFLIEKDTYLALKHNVYLIEKISIERIREELTKIILSVFLENSNILLESNMLDYINIGLKNYLNKYLNINIKYIKKCNYNEVERFALLFKDMDSNNLLKILKYFRFSNNNIKHISILVQYINFKIEKDLYTIRKILNKIGKELFFEVLSLQNVLGNNINEIKELTDNILKNRDPLNISDLKIDGNIIRMKTLCKDKEIGNILIYLLDSVLKNPYLNEETILVNLSCEFVKNKERVIDKN